MGDNACTPCAAGTYSIGGAVTNDRWYAYFPHPKFDGFIFSGGRNRDTNLNYSISQATQSPTLISSHVPFPHYNPLYHNLITLQEWSFIPNEHGRLHIVLRRCFDYQPPYPFSGRRLQWFLGARDRLHSSWVCFWK